MKNIVDCVAPGIDLALSRQLWLALEDEHSLLAGRIYFSRSSPGEKRSRHELLGLGLKTHRLRYAMHDLWESTWKLRNN